MKHLQKITCILLALLLVCAMGTTVFAENTSLGGNKISVTNAQPGETYKLYKLLDLSVSKDLEAYTYTLNTEWSEFFTTGAGSDYVNLTDIGDSKKAVAWKSDASSVETFGKAAATAAASKSALQTKVAGEEGDILDFADLEPGYYLVTSTNGTLAIVESTPRKPETVIEEKNQNPTLDKQVQEDSQISTTGQGWGKENSAQIGDIVNFKLTVAVKKGAKSYVIHDKMDDGLTFNANSVTIPGLTKDTHYTVVTSNLTDGCTFEIHFAETYLNSIATDDTLTVTYNATLNANADMVDGEKNDAKITWGESSKTEWSETVTKTYDFKVLKYKSGDENKAPLAGAKFQLKLGDTVIKLIKVSDTEYRVANGNEEGAVESFVTVASKSITIKGLDLDTYTLVELEAPAGFNKLKEDITVKVEADKVTVVKTGEDDNVEKNDRVVEVPNSTGTQLPSTGGMGTTMFYVFGSILAAAAAILLVTKKRMSAEA